MCCVCLINRLWTLVGRKQNQKMVVNTRELMNIVGTLGDVEEIRFTVRSSAKGAAITGVGAFIGGICGGPIGLPIGGAIGGFIGMKAMNSFKPLSQIVQQDLTALQQEELKNRLVRLVKEINVLDAVQLLVLLQTDKMLMQVVIKESVSFITQATSAMLTES